MLMKSYKRFGPIIFAYSILFFIVIQISGPAQSAKALEISNLTGIIENKTTSLSNSPPTTFETLENATIFENLSDNQTTQIQDNESQGNRSNSTLSVFTQSIITTNMK